MDRIHDGLKSEKAWREIIFHARLGSIPAEKVQTHTNILLSKRWMRSIGRHKKYIFQLLYCIHIFQKRALLFCSLQWVVWNKVLFFSLHHSCFAMLRKVIFVQLQKVLTRLFGKPQWCNSTIQIHTKTKTLLCMQKRLYLPIFISRSVWIKHIWLCSASSSNF